VATTKPAAELCTVSFSTRERPERATFGLPLKLRVGTGIGITVCCGIGVVGFGGVLRWVLPSTGNAQRYRILDSLIDTQVVASYAWRDVAVIPTRTLPPQALVVAITPLADPRMLEALADLRARGVDLAVIDVSPMPFVEAPRGEVGALAYRLWRMQRDHVGSRYRAMGVPVVEWVHGRPVVRGQRLATMDQGDLMERVRALTAQWRPA